MRGDFGALTARPAPTDAGERPSRLASATACGYALVVAAGIAHFLLAIPIQLTDSFGNMLKLETGWRDLLVREFTQRSYMRPFLWAELKLVYDASAGHYAAWFRGTHALQVLALVCLFLALLRPRTWRDALLVPLGLGVLIGLHTFRGTVDEAFPINTFLTIVLCCLAAANLAFLRHRWWVDVLASVVFAVAALTVETGLLVWVVFAAAALLGARGVSRAGLGVLTAMLAGYFVLRFAVLEVGAPGLMERASGYGFGILEPRELVERFGDAPWRFYAYNIASSVLTVLFSEPRGGVFRLTYGAIAGQPEPSAIVNVLASLGATTLLVLFAWRRRAAWRAKRFDGDDRLVLLFPPLLAANAAISYAYTKDVIMSPAGTFFAVAVFAAARGLIRGGAGPRRPWTYAAVLVCSLLLGTTWAVRSVSLHRHLREMARKVRTEWVYADDWFARERIDLTPVAAQTLLRRLRDDAINRQPPVPFPLAHRVLID